jgi:hypothetical protein
MSVAESLGIFFFLVTYLPEFSQYKLTVLFIALLPHWTCFYVVMFLNVLCTVGINKMASQLASL